MNLTFWGVRGSIPTPGKDTVRYGGNTPCVEVRLENGRLLILDAGTGIRNLGDALVAAGEEVRAHVFITHPHWDHIQGFPFFKPAFLASTTLTVVGTERPEKSLKEIIADQMDRVYFPVQLHDLEAKIDFHPVHDEESLAIDDATVRMMFVHHPGFTLGYRIEHLGKTIVYISDNEPFDPSMPAEAENSEASVLERFTSYPGDPNNRIVEFCKNADILIHDATYTPEEYAERKGWGHSDFPFAMRIAHAAHVKHLLLFHHDPSHTDEMLDALGRRCQQEIENQKYRFTCEMSVENATWKV